MLQLEEKCRVEMENHKQMLDKEYETLLTSFRKELEKLHVKHQQDLDRKVSIVPPFTVLIINWFAFSSKKISFIIHLWWQTNDLIFHWSKSEFDWANNLWAD